MGSQQSLYAKLDSHSRQVRLIHIQPGKWDDPILCELETVSLNSSPVYQTLSYTWGEPEPTKPILIEDCVLDVRINLHEALRRLRCRSSTRVIWVDAICINQEDLDERAQQVMLMKSIYTSCREVIMWLGNGVSEQHKDSLTIEEGSNKLVEYFAAQPESFRHPDMAGKAGYEVYDAFIIILLLGKNKHLIDQPCFHHIYGGGLNGDETPAVVRRFRNAWQMLGRIMALPYWNRIWIVQENILPPFATVVLGSISIPWKAFSDAVEGYKSHISCCRLEISILPEETTNVFKPFSNIVQEINTLRSLKEQGVPLDVNSLLRLSRGRQATDQRDRVYGLLGLVTFWPTERRVVPDYSLSNTPKEMFADLTIYLIQSMDSTRGLEILGHQRRFCPDVPSWVVDWVEDPDAIKWRMENTRVELMYCHYCVTNHNFVVARRLSKERLKVQGLMVDTVLDVGRYVPSPDWDGQGCLPTLAMILNMGGQQRSPESEYRGGGTWEDAHWRTVCGDLFQNEMGKFRRTVPEDKTTFEKWRRGYVEVDRQFPWSRDQQRALDDVQIPVIATVVNRRVFVTKGGYLGFGPRDMEVGDQVFILSGSNVPFVLREYEATKSNPLFPAYHLLGDCYVHGIMYGEAHQSGWDGNARPLVLY